MNISGIFSTKRYTIVAAVTFILILIFILINLFVIGGDEFIIRLNGSITVFLAILTTLSAVSLWNLVNKGRNNPMLWGGLLAGWASWAIAEILWLVYGYVYQDIPYPSPADFFWLIGYLPVGFGLYIRSREIPAKLTILQNSILWAISLVTIVITTIYILIPIIQSNDPSNWLESVLNVVYPLADLFLLIIVIRLIFVYGGGDYGFGWSLLTIGFILQPISDLVFSYASLSGLYYPDQKVNFISSMAVDVPYTLSYLIWFLGLYALRLALGRHKPFEKIDQPRLISNTSVLIFLDGNNRVFETNGNILLVSNTDQGRGASLSELLGIPQQEAQTILDKIQRERKITDQPILLGNHSGVSRQALLCGIATFSPDGKYSGCNLVMRIPVENDYTLDEKLTKEQRSMVAYLRKASGSSERDQIRKLLLDYHLAYLKRLYNLAYRTGGAQLGHAFLDHLQQIDREHQWHLQFHPETLLNETDYQLSLLREALPILLHAAKRFVAQVTDPITVESEMQLVSSQFSEAVHKNVKFYS